MIDRAQAEALLNEYTKSDSLKKHALAVEAAMRWYARHFAEPDEKVELWGVAGLLHDFDYERFPDCSKDGHPFKGNEVLVNAGYPEEVTNAILAHADYSGVARNTKMAQTLYAVDELCGFVIACALVRPDRSLTTLEVKSVKKRMKDKAFARACNRDDIRKGAEELQIDLDQHIQNTIEALREIAEQLGLVPLQ